MGAEIGISTGRLHARGPVGTEQLTCFKYIVRGMDKYVHELDRAPKRGKNLACSLSIATTINRLSDLWAGHSTQHIRSPINFRVSYKTTGLNKVWWLVSPQNPLSLQPEWRTLKRVQML